MIIAHKHDKVLCIKSNKPLGCDGLVRGELYTVVGHEQLMQTIYYRIRGRTNLYNIKLFSQTPPIQFDEELFTL